MNFLTFKTKLIYGFSLIALVTLIYSFSSTKTPQKNEYLSLTVEYFANHQLIYVFKKDIEIERIAIITPQKYVQRVDKYKRRKYTIIKKNIQSLYDNTTIFKLVQKYEEQDWILKSHSLGFTDSHSSRISQYLMSRKSN